MPSLIPLHQQTIGSQALQTANAREVHAFLAVNTRYDTWIQRRIETYGFVQDIDYTMLTSEQGPVRTIEYFVTLDMAKQLAMVERTAKGREARLYFLECERQAKAATALQAFPISYAQMALQTAQALVEMEQRQLALEATQDTHTAQIAALQERQPPEGRMHVHQYIRAYSKPYLPASVMDSLKYHARRLETPVLWLPEGFGHEVPYYTLETLHAAYLEATRQLSFIHDPGVAYRRLPRRGGHRG